MTRGLSRCSPTMTQNLHRLMIKCPLNSEREIYMIFLFQSLGHKQCYGTTPFSLSRGTSTILLSSQTLK